MCKLLLLIILPAKESRLVALKRPNRTEFVDWFQLLGSDATRPTYSSGKKRSRTCSVSCSVCVCVSMTYTDWEFCKIRSLIKPDVHTDKYQVAAGETLVYKEREEVDGLDNEWFQLLGGRSLPTQHSFSSLSSGKFNLPLSFHVLCLQF